LQDLCFYRKKRKTKEKRKAWAWSSPQRSRPNYKDLAQVKKSPSGEAHPDLNILHQKSGSILKTIKTLSPFLSLPLRESDTGEHPRATRKLWWQKNYGGKSFASLVLDIDRQRHKQIRCHAAAIHVYFQLFFSSH
jgi:hypothetical protein